MRRMVKKHVGFTLVELLTVIALIVIIAAVAVPNFAAMVREQRWTSAISSIQTAIMRARTYAVNEELDHAVEFCTAPDGSTYLRIEAESAFLESVPNLREYIIVVDSFLLIPRTWTGAFLARRDAWGSDGYRFHSGIVDVYWDRAMGSYGTGWGHLCQNYGSVASSTYYNMRNYTRFYYDQRYKDRYGFGKADMTQPWIYPEPSGWRCLSIDEHTNVAGEIGYQDVNDSQPFSNMCSTTQTEVLWHIRDNLAVDDMLYLPHDIRLNLNHAQSNLINFDVAKSSSGEDVVNHGWDATSDLRFGKSGHLLQARTPVIVITRQGKDGMPDQHIRLRLLRGTGRLKKLN